MTSETGRVPNAPSLPGTRDPAARWRRFVNAYYDELETDEEFTAARHRLFETLKCIEPAPSNPWREVESAAMTTWTVDKNDPLLASLTVVHDRLAATYREVLHFAAVWRLPKPVDWTTMSALEALWREFLTVIAGTGGGLLRPHVEARLPQSFQTLLSCRDGEGPGWKIYSSLPLILPPTLPSTKWNPVDNTDQELESYLRHCTALLRASVGEQAEGWRRAAAKEGWNTSDSKRDDATYSTAARWFFLNEVKSVAKSVIAKRERFDRALVVRRIAEYKRTVATFGQTDCETFPVTG